MINLPIECNSVVFVIKPVDYQILINGEKFDNNISPIKRLPDVTLFAEDGYLTVSSFKLPLNLRIDFETEVEVCHIDFKISGRYSKLLDSFAGGEVSAMEFSGNNLKLLDSAGNECSPLASTAREIEMLKSEMDAKLAEKDEEIETLRAQVDILSKESPLQNDQQSLNAQFESIDADYTVENQISEGVIESVKAIKKLRDKTAASVKKFNKVMELYVLFKESVFLDISNSHFGRGQLDEGEISEEKFISKVSHILNSED